MKLARPHLISEIDKYSAEVLGISTVELMGKSGRAVAAAVRSYVAPGAFIAILAGSGNNGGDGYAAAKELLSDYKVKVYDVFSAGQKTEEGKYYFKLFSDGGGEIENVTLSPSQRAEIKSAACIVDAVFGTGFKGEIPDTVKALATLMSEAVGSQKIAVDVPIGVNADDGSADLCTAFVHAVIELSFIKPGIVSYPARSYIGTILYDDLGLPSEKIEKKFDFKYTLIDEAFAEKCLPVRKNNSHKGSFGKALLITGSTRYPGAGRLTLEAALRGGSGLVNYLGDAALAEEYVREFPEVIYKGMDMEKEEASSLAVELSAASGSTLIGSGSGNNAAIALITKKLLESEGGTLILDADAINSISEEYPDAPSLIKNAKRPVILTPHPLEFARLSGVDVATVQNTRLASAVRFAKENGCVLVLKGAGTIVTDGEEVLINGSGSSALAKAGSGDVLAGFIASLAAGKLSPINAAALGVYYHGKAGDNLAKEFSTYGVTPSDLPKEIARAIAKTQNT